MRGKLLLLALIGCVYAQSIGQIRENKCVGQKSCGGCISADESCGWCLEEGYDKDNRPRCDRHTNLVDNGCDWNNIAFPSNDIRKTKNAAVQDGDTAEDAVQLQPQEMYMKIRPNMPVKFSITFRQAENYPVDLYYLMDLSNSMEDDKAKLAELGNLIAVDMSKITKNFRLGFGSFVDKVVMPYVSTVPAKLQKPCTNCVPPYGFKNQLQLSLNTSLFALEVLRAKVSGNLDAPEGGLDAMMQAVMCDGDIGWRNVSRRMMVFSTDAGFHYAGDGKLGGIVKPNDGLCHMRHNMYTESSNQDYPSISQMAAKISERKVNVIFAVTKDQLPVYEKLSKLIEGSVAGELADDSSNVVELVRKNYEKITSKVELNAQDAENVTITFKSRCRGNVMKETNKCENMKIGQNVTFDVEVFVTGCPAEPAKRVRSFYIYPVGLAEKLEIYLDLICECDCEKNDKELNSPKCSAGNGTFACGVCSCNNNRYGKFCECDGSDASSDKSEQSCIEPNATLACTGRGECVCGICECFSRRPSSPQKYTGEFCQCDDYSCSYHDGDLCGGPERGSCDCGFCRCKNQFEGVACECDTTNTSCIAANGKLCNGYGTCDCGRCECEKNSQYKGPTCEDCPTCSGKCNENTGCVQCKVFSSGDLTTEECNKCPHVHKVDVLEDKEGVRKCQFKDSDDCIVYFTYEYDENQDIKLTAQKQKVCPESVNILAIVLGVIGGIVAVGLAVLLIWKLLTTIHDRREFAKFERETQNAKWDTGENPIYKQPTSTFKNPTYAGKS